MTFMKKLSAVFLLVNFMSSAEASQTIICSNFDYFDADFLNSFRDQSRLRLGNEKISDWQPGESFSDDVDRIVIALPKDATDQEVDCVDRVEQVASGVKAAIKSSRDIVGTLPTEYEKIIIGKPSGGPVFGPVTMKVSYVRTSSLVVQIVVSDDVEPVRSIDAVERYFDLPLGYCEQNENCGIGVGEP